MFQIVETTSGSLVALSIRCFTCFDFFFMLSWQAGHVNRRLKIYFENHNRHLHEQIAALFMMGSSRILMRGIFATWALH